TGRHRAESEGEEEREREMLVDASSSLLFSLILAQLPFITSALPLNHKRGPDLEKLTNQTRHLLKLTQELRLKTTLPQLLFDLQSFELHLEWLSRASRKHRHTASPNLAKLGDLIVHTKTISASLQRQMLKVDALRLPTPTPSLPPLPEVWNLVQCSREILDQFSLFLDWASRALLTLKSKI
ncbi:hypothetical protein JZ751_009458, partial [Albula glossodonta]